MLRMDGLVVGLVEPLQRGVCQLSGLSAGLDHRKQHTPRTGDARGHWRRLIVEQCPRLGESERALRQRGARMKRALLKVAARAI